MSQSAINWNAWRSYHDSIYCQSPSCKIWLFLKTDSCTIFLLISEEARWGHTPWLPSSVSKEHSWWVSYQSFSCYEDVSLTFSVFLRTDIFLKICSCNYLFVSCMEQCLARLVKINSRLLGGVTEEWETLHPHIQMETDNAKQNICNLHLTQFNR